MAPPTVGKAAYMKSESSKVTHFFRGALLIVLPFLLAQAMPLSRGQGKIDTDAQQETISPSDVPSHHSGAAVDQQNVLQPTPSSVTLTGSITASDPTQTDRLFRDAIASTCAAPKTCPGVFGDGLARHYDAYTFTNTSGSTQCFTVTVDAMTCTGGQFLQAVAYLGSFDPANLCTNYLADIGGSPNPTGSFSFNVTAGQTFVLVINEANMNAGCASYTVTVDQSSLGVCSGPGTDFNGDSKQDYVLYNGSTRHTAVWYLNNNVFAGSAFAPTLPAGWNVIDVADFNGDDSPDYALFNATTRQTAIWYLSGATFISAAFGPTLPSGWALVAVGDFNGDCKPDYVLYRASTRQTAVWYLNNNVFAGGAFGRTVPAGWNLAGVADFNRDGKTDYLLFNASTRQSVIWYLSGVTFVTAAAGPTIASGYQLIGVADFNGDGKPDYVLYNPSTRRTAIWYLNNNVFAGSAFGPILPAGWNLVAP
jgi:hypothetical protein